MPTKESYILLYFLSQRKHTLLTLLEIFILDLTIYLGDFSISLCLLFNGCIVFNYINVKKKLTNFYDGYLDYINSFAIIM